MSVSENANVVVDVATVAEAAQMELEAQKQAEIEACRKLLLRAVGSFRKGTRAYAASYLECAAIVTEYTSRRLALGFDRGIIVRKFETDLSSELGENVKGAEMLRAHAAFHLLSKDTQVKPADVKIAWFEGGFNLLVDRIASDKSESWTLLPGMESECRAFFDTTVKNGFARKEVCDACAKLEHQHNAKVMEASRAKQAEIDAENERKANEAKAAREAAELTERLAKAANEAAEKAKIEAAAAPADATKEAELVAAQESAKLAAQQKKEADELAKQKEKDAKEAERLAQRVGAQVSKAEKAHERSEERVEKRTATAGEVKQENLIRGVEKSAAAASPKDAAEWMMKILRSSSAPNDVFDAFLVMVKDSKDSDKRMKSAADGALLALRRDAK